MVLGFSESNFGEACQSGADRTFLHEVKPNQVSIRVILKLDLRLVDSVEGTLCNGE